jgi:hypothetical protein
MVCLPISNDSQSSLKSDLIGHWMAKEWLATRTDTEWVTLWSADETVYQDVLAGWNADFKLADEYTFDVPAVREVECPVATPLSSKDWEGALTHRAGAYIYRFVGASQPTVEIMVVSSHYTDTSGHILTLAAVPKSFVPAWHAFEIECRRIAHGIEPSNEVIIVGGRSNAFVPTVEWSDVILPEKLKADIMDDVQSFFTRGIDIYKRLNLKPFRKLLLAGVPGTGKTMICSALAKWALEQHYVVIYVSSASKRQDEAYGSTFGKIQYALMIASSSAYPAMILLEELDAYLHEEEKALVLNVLDGSESSISDKGTLLISTTNYPEAIDERVLKRPGRLDRIFIIPEMRQQIDAEAMLRKYLGAVWQDSHAMLVPQLVGYPGAFIREVAIYALTQMAYDDLAELSYAMLESSFRGLKDQIDARDDFLKKRNGSLGLVPEGAPANGSNGHE